MVSTLTEAVILTFKPEANIEEIISTLFQVLHKQDGYHGGVWGRWVEDANKVQLFHQWDSMASHNSFSASTNFQEILTILIPALDGTPSLHHVNFNPSAFSKIVKSPVTEVLTLYQPGATVGEDFKDIGQVLAQSDAFHGALIGAVVEEFGDEKLKVYQVVAGWDSAEKHQEAFKALGVAEKFGHVFQAVKERELHHVKFVKG